MTGRDLDVMSGERSGQRGVTLLELMVAMILLVMVTAMLYSVLDAGIGFAHKGGQRLRRIERDSALLELLHRQVHGAWYDRLHNRVLLSVDGDYLRLVTTAPLLNRGTGLVLAVYYYDRARDRLYYTEKKDFYNPDYEKDYRPDESEMETLMKEVGEISWEYDEGQGVLKLLYGGREYSLTVRSWRPGILP